MESNIRKCKVCGQEKQRILAGTYPNNKDKKWKQEDGKLWNGNTCGDCNVKESYKKMRKARGKTV